MIRIGVLISALALVLTAGQALAHHKEGHERGGSQGKQAQRNERGWLGFQRFDPESLPGRSCFG